MWYSCYKKIICGLIICLLSVPVANADDWIAPAIIGGILGYSLGSPRQQYIYQTPPPVYNLNQMYRTQPIYQYQTIYDTYCNCYRQVLVQIN